ncbi:Mix17p NDAI_0F01750 [Naumovozyma dairenensis CBS 421]|uniref:CHCH domain-containing protein n=1 Tax=Naumovozyma dairenensis (strain ATCC 10597 / BCRC 20456 / CBS 421 / NBRC 0211 / NRRL Y-12639) TaxID=1071378 RepID=G0WCI3_NAUDC|nr:hypothetical protein NDAI_0F01750 [Naumovozyma dairenensis CBS 421]CCD25494.1 hypothetical protein NDAI_0F01750 [Naumovozyma dairenensis CBS 421]
MARSRGSRPMSRGSSRPISRSTGGPTQQTRSASTAAAPTNYQQQPNAYSHPQAAVPTSQGPGLFGQMASTAAGVAVGSSIGHAVGGLLFGGGGSRTADVDQPQQQDVTPQATASTLQQEQGRSCDGAAKSFTKCLDDNDGNFQICDYYLQQLKACQEAARQY